MKKMVLWLLILFVAQVPAQAAGRTFVRIAEPLDDVVIPSGFSIYLRGQVFTGFQVRGKEDWIAAADIDAVWSISDGRTFSSLSPSAVFFDDPGVYTIGFEATVDGTSATTYRQVTVVDMGTGFLDPLSSESEVRWVSPGIYAPVTFDPGHPARTLAFSVTHPDTVYSFWVSQSAGDLRLQLRNLDGNPIDPSGVTLQQEAGCLQVQALAPGDYVLVLSLPSHQATASCEVHFEALTPDRTVAHVESNGDAETGIYVVYPGSEKACPVDYAAYDASGVEVDRQTHLLLPGQARHFRVGDVFHEPERIAWIRIHAGYHILAHGFVFDRQGGWSRGAIAPIMPSKNLVVPELASEFRGLTSRYGLANIAERDTLVYLQTTQLGYDLDGFLERRSLSTGSFSDLYHGDEPGGADWGVFTSNAAAPQLIGLQILDLADGATGSAALPWFNPLSDPIHGTRYLVLPYVQIHPGTGAWTDMVVANLEDVYSSYHVILYNEWGQVLGERTQTIDRLEKQRYSVADFSADFLDDPTAIAWMEIHAATDMTGCIIFGTQNQIADYVAALPIARHGVTRLWHHLTAGDEADWTKAALLNLADVPNDVTVFGLDALGKTVLKHDFVINPKKRFWGTAEEIFNALFASPDDWQRIAVIRVDAALPITGFQLSGDATGQHLSAFMADR